MKSGLDLEIESNKFFERHWPKESIRPKWNFDWKWMGAIPNYELGGVYALFNGENLIYIGLGASRGGGIYLDRGVSRRLLAHVIKRAPKDTEVDYILRENWHHLGINLIATIGFPADLSYLACSLEDYLIGKLNPPANKMKIVSENEKCTD